MFEPIRGGTRGGQAEFKWSDVSADKDRENYLGHSINAPTGRWQKNKDVHWYSRDKQQAEDERAAEIKGIKDLEADALAVALGFEPAKKPAPGTTTATSHASPTSPTDTSPTPTTNATNAQRAIEREAKRRRKAERKEEKRARKEEKKRMRTVEREPYRNQRYAIHDGRGRGMRSRSRSRTLPPSPPPPPRMNRRSASPRHRALSSRRRPLSRSLSRSPLRRPDSYRDTLASAYVAPARGRLRSFSRSSLGSSRSRTPPPRRQYESQKERRDLPIDREGYSRDRQVHSTGDSNARRDLSDSGYHDRRR